MDCARCGSSNLEGAKFCDECSAPLPQRCPACDEANRPSAKFCSRCAAPLTAEAANRPSTQPETAEQRGAKGERRHLSVLFCDLVGSTGMAAVLDPEDWREVVTSYHRSVGEVVARFDGYVAQLLGDGVLVFFGFPEAHEDDPHRAVLAGLAILDAMAGLNERFASKRLARLAARIGIHCGAVVVDESNAMGANVFGDVPNIASRVQGAAAPDTLLITGAVHHLVSGLFVVEDRGSQALKGVAEPIHLYRVIQPSGARGRLAAAAGRGLTPFVGREDELRLLLNRWELARAGDGQVMLVIGEAGIGKSRLVQRFREQIADQPHTWVDCAAAALHQNTPFYAVEDLLQQGFRWRGEQNDEERLAGLEASLKIAGIDPAEAVPLLAPLMNLRPSAKYPPLEMPPDQQRKRLLATIVAWTLGSATLQPLVIQIEDLHWADPSTLEVMELLTERAASAAILMIGTARNEFRAPWPLRAHHAQLTLNRLNARNSREIVAQMTQNSALSNDTVEAMVARSGGVPLFVEELTRSVIEGGVFKPAPREIPATLVDSLMARLDRLGDAREVAQVASVIGQEFSLRLISGITAIDDQRLGAALKKLTDAELLVEQGVAPEAGYHFRHALIQDAAYQSLLRAKRQGYHRRIAEVLTERFPEAVATQPHLLAHHYTEADLGAQAIPHWHNAGRNAVQRSANAEAVSHLARGLELLSAQAATPERFQQELALQLAIGTPLIATKGFASPEVGKVYGRARELCQMAGEVPQLFPVLWGLWVFYTARADHGVARELADQCLRLATAAGDADMLLEAHHALGVTLTGLAQFAPGLEHLDYVIANYDPVRHGSIAFAFGQDPKVVCLSQAAWVLWLEGFPDQALKRNEEALALARSMSHPYSLAAALSFGAMVHQLCQNERAVRECAEASITLSDEKQFALWRPWGLVMRGWAMTKSGKVTEGIQQMRDGVAHFRATGADVMVPYFLGLLAEALGLAGQVSEGVSVLAEAQAVVERGGECWWEPELYRVKGELTLLQVEEAEAVADSQRSAENWFLQARRKAAHLNAKSLELRAAMSLGRLWRSQGRNAEASRLLAETYGSFDEGFETTDLKSAKTHVGEAS